MYFNIKITNETIYSWAKDSLKTLIISSINNFDGIKLNIDSPYSNPMLNIIRPAVLRQYYGLNLDDIKITEQLKDTQMDSILQRQVQVAI